MPAKDLKVFLDRNVIKYNTPAFIEFDPISVPHRFSKKQDIEIAGFFAAIFSWGNRTTIIKKSLELIKRMDNSPFDFILNHKEKNLEQLKGFKHRTFTEDDLLYFIMFLQYHYKENNTLESAFISSTGSCMEDVLAKFKQRFFSFEHMRRTEKHISSPAQGSTCKRLNMFLRWMVRKDSNSVDFGIWKKIDQSNLICPIDLHVARVAKKLGLLKRKQVDWLAAVELTNELKKFDSTDPVKYDFALFNLGIIEKF